MVLQRTTSVSKKKSKSTEKKRGGEKGCTCDITKGHEWKQKKIVKVLKKREAKKKLDLWYYKWPRVEAGLRRVVFDTRRGEPFEFVPFLFFYSPRRLALFFESY